MYSTYIYNLLLVNVSVSLTVSEVLPHMTLVPALFAIPLVFKIQGDIFEVYTLVSEIQDKMDLILGVKNIFKLEGVINSRT